MKKEDRRVYNFETVKTDCFAYKAKEKINCNKCDALNDLYCGFEEKCKFYKTKEEEKKERIKYM